MRPPIRPIRAPPSQSGEANLLGVPFSIDDFSIEMRFGSEPRHGLVTQGDAAIRWQVMQDLADAPQSTVEAERRKMAREGWGAALLAKPDANGRWTAGLSNDDGMYLPKWISTTYTMLMLRDFGLPRPTAGPTGPAGTCSTRVAARRRHQLRHMGEMDKAWRDLRDRYGPYLSLILSLSYFRYEDLDSIAGRLLDEQMTDGGWNCRRRGGAAHSSVHTTISVLEGLRFYELLRRSTGQLVATAQRAWSRISAAASALPLSPYREDHQTGVHQLHVSSPLALRYPASARPLSSGRRSWGQAAGGSDRNRTPYSSRRRALASTEFLQGEDIFRPRACRTATSLEHAARSLRVLKGWDRQPN